MVLARSITGDTANRNRPAGFQGSEFPEELRRRRARVVDAARAEAKHHFNSPTVEVHLMGPRGEMVVKEATRWKHGILGLTVLWDFEPGDVTFVNFDPLS
jgi:hypothetical protein